LQVALGWLWGAYRLAINRLCSGFDVALMWLWVALARKGVSGGMILPENRRFDIPFFFPGLFFRLFS
jgi:hypothetical protein